jgi:hypothetical protein
MLRKLTELTHTRFNELVTAMDDSSLLERWADGYEPHTKAERVESRQIRALGCWVDSGRSLRKLQVLPWSRMELLTDGKDIFVRLLK